VRVAIASSEVVPDQFDEDRLIVAALARRGVEAGIASWDSAGVDWDGFELVVVRSTWDYTTRLDEFLAWADGIGDRLHNSAAVLRWNSDKRYVGDLEAAGLPVVPTRYVEPGEEVGELEGEVVVKPTVSAGGRDTGRFTPAVHDEARALLARLGEAGRTAMVQPYLADVDSRGESALVHVAGEFSHGLRKLAVLRPDEVAPVRDDPLGAAEAMYDPDLVRAAETTEEEREVAHRILDHVAERFGAMPLYARVDLVPGPDGTPVLIELEAIEPNLYLYESPETADRLAEAIVAELG
jgi:glutathione synthase/RimK-type ligase-like ATP-grasp enzyme